MQKKDIGLLILILVVGTITAIINPLFISPINLANTANLVGLFGIFMTTSGWLWTRMKWDELDPMLGVPAGLDYLALVIAGVLIVLFSFEHILALLRGEEVVPAWY